MSNEISVEQLLRWRAPRAETEAPPAPRAARLLELGRPWWETWPERFHRLVERLGSIQIAYGPAMAEPVEAPRSGYPVPALVVRRVEELERRVVELERRLQERPGFAPQTEAAERVVAQLPTEKAA